jgi:hypothetical protein
MEATAGKSFALRHAAALPYSCPNLALGTSFAKFNPPPDTLAMGSAMENMDNHVKAFHMEWCHMGIM